MPNSLQKDGDGEQPDGADLRTPRGIDRSVMAHLADGGWIARHENLLITRLTGLGKSWIACALGHKACREGRPVLYQRAPRMFEALALARGDGRHERTLKTIAHMDVLIIDDWGLALLTAPERRDLLEILEDRHGRAPTIVTSQLPVEHWHEVIGDATLTDAILDSLVHNAHRLKLTGESMRKAQARNTTLTCQRKPDSMKPSVKSTAHHRVEWLPEMPWDECPRSRGITAHLPWNAHVVGAITTGCIRRPVPSYVGRKGMGRIGSTVDQSVCGGRKRDRYPVGKNFSGFPLWVST